MDNDLLVNDLMPNSSEAQGVYEPAVSPEQAAEEREEISKLLTAKPLIEELLQWFDGQIAACDSVAQVHVTAKVYDQAPADVLMAHDIVRRLLESKRDELLARLDALEKRDD